MESTFNLQQSETKCGDNSNTERKNPNSKSKVNNSKSSHRQKKHSLISYLEDDIDKDVILRMVLPGYNWFEDQVKNNMYTAEGEKRITSERVSVNPKLKPASQSTSTPEPLVDNKIEIIIKQKSALTKMVMNSTLMLLPNNSLPLKKRKIKEELEESENEEQMEINNLIQTHMEDTKKVINPPIQKVTPILNINKPKISAFEKVSTEIFVPQNKRLSAFKNDHLQKKFSLNQCHQNNINNTSNIYTHTEPLEPHLQYEQMIRKNTSFPITDMKTKYAAPLQHTNTNYCPHCNIFCYQNSHLNKFQNQDSSKLGLNPPLNQTILPQKTYWPSNCYQAYRSYDPLAIPENDQTYSRFQQSSKFFDSFNTFLTLPEQISSSYFNMNNPTYCANNYWNKSTIPQNKYVQMNPMRNEYNHSNFMDPLNTMPMNSQTRQLFLKGYHPI